MHYNDRGTHTTVIEAALPVLTFLHKTRELGVRISPGKIEGGVGAKSKSIKLKHINNELYEMVITHNGARQEFKVFTSVSAETLMKALKSAKKLQDWNSNYTDMRDVHSGMGKKETKLG
jgi:hypothetical protein